MPAIRAVLSVLAALSLGCIRASGAAERYSDGSTAQVGAEEAVRLYQSAVQFIKNIPEGEFSYAYIQFHWKRAQANIDRILKVYPGTPTATGLRNGTLQLGAFERTYFKERVLPALEDKRLATVDDVNCAYFLFSRDESRWDETRIATMEAILEVMTRRGRWGEALGFPCPEAYRDRFYTAIFRVAARKDQQDIMKSLFTEATPERAEQYWAILGEAQALLGQPRADLAKLLDEHSSTVVKLAILQGMATREADIQRGAALKRKFDPAAGIQTAHYTLRNLDVRDNVEGFAQTLFSGGQPAANAILATYRAALGTRPAANANLEAHFAYLGYLGAFEKFDEIDSYITQPALSEATRQAAEIKAIEVLAEADRLADAERRLNAVATRGRAQADAAALAQFRGRLNDYDSPFEIRQNAFAQLRISDPCLLAQAIMARSLAVNRPFRGPTPWDAVVFRFVPGFENLPEPKSAEAAEASSTLKPY